MESTLFYLRVSFISCFIGGHHFVILHNISGKMEHPLTLLLLTPTLHPAESLVITQEIYSCNLAVSTIGTLEHQRLNMMDVEETQSRVRYLAFPAYFLIFLIP